MQILESVGLKFQSGKTLDIWVMDVIATTPEGDLISRSKNTFNKFSKIFVI